jgi:hypothetical protein
MTTENNEVTGEVTASNVAAETIMTNASVGETSSTTSNLPFGTGFTQDDLSKAREQEKAKLYPQMEKLKDELATLKKERDDRAAEEERNRQAAMLEQQKQQEEEMDVRSLLQKKEQEFAAQLEAERLERERAFALLEQEKHFQDVMQYRQQRLEQERDLIIPELVDLIEGNDRDEIEQSITNLKNKSAQILGSVQAASQSARREMAGTRVTAPASGPLDNDSEQRSYSPESIRDMSLADYAKQRAKLLGEAAGNRGRGLFG